MIPFLFPLMYCVGLADISQILHSTFNVRRLPRDYRAQTICLALLVKHSDTILT